MLRQNSLLKTKRREQYLMSTNPIFRTYIAVLALLSTALVQADTSLIAVIDDVMRTKCLDPSQTAISIVGAPGGNLVYAQNTQLPLLPASVVKLLTTAAALRYLSPEYRFKTDVLYSGNRSDNVIEGDIIVRGGGDPLLSSAQLRHMAEHVAQSGIRQIKGRLLVDTHFFDAYDRAPAWDEKRSQRPYDAKLGALSINFNSVAVNIRAGAASGAPVTAWLEPAPTYMILNNEASTVGSRGKNTVWAQRKHQDGHVYLELRGQLPQDAPDRTILVNVDHPARFAADSFRLFLTQAGITIQGETILNAIAPAHASLIYRHTSPPLSVILKELNTYSNNFIAEQIVKTIAAEHLGAPGTHANGLMLITKFLREELGINTQSLTLVDGSGLSRQNRFTAQAMTEFLSAILSRFDIGPDFIAAIRVMGAQGNLSNRLKHSPASAQVRAKTGSLYGVSNLAGYVAGADGGLYAYALFLNNNQCGYGGADKLEDRIISAIHTFDKHDRQAPLVSSMWLPGKNAQITSGRAQPTHFFK
jgi:serine-type D-Ala-D-Ala carboxypeptidase/endopeptidase (penicillin-binding protein 4)